MWCRFVTCPLRSCEAKNIPPAIGTTRLKLRIAIVVVGLLIGLLAREAVKYYRQFRPHPAVTPLPAATTPAIKVERKK